jgi:polyisoprenoid-binding protein YceI
MRSLIRIAVMLVATTLATAGETRAQQAYSITGGRITVVCSLTVGGSFEARTKSLSGELSVPPAEGTTVIQGTFQVDFETLETGIGLRDRHMRRDYLQVDKGQDFSTATLNDLRIEKLDGKTTFAGVLRLHGQSKQVSGTADLQRRDGAIRVEARFPLRMSEFQIPIPAYLGVGVRDEIQVDVILTAVPGARHFVGNRTSR